MKEHIGGCDGTPGVHLRQGRQAFLVGTVLRPVSDDSGRKADRQYDHESHSLSKKLSRHNAALNCRRLVRRRAKLAVAVALQGDQTRWLPWTSRLTCCSS